MLYPLLLPHDAAAVPALMTLRAHVEPLSEAADGPGEDTHAAAVVEGILALTAPFQPEPISRQQLTWLTSLRESETAQVISELTSDGWWKQQLRTTLGFGMMEVQHGPAQNRCRETLKANNDNYDVDAAAWDVIMSESGLLHWVRVMRPDANNRLVEAAMENVKARLSWLSSGGAIGPTAAIEQSQTSGGAIGPTAAIEQSQTLAKRATWMATHLDTAEWSAISQQAIKLSADFTAGTRWQTAIERIQALKERCAEEAGEGGDLDILAERVSEACIACAGVVASADDQEMLVVAGRHCLYSDWCTPNVAVACQHVMSFVPTSEYVPEHAWLAVVVAGLALVHVVETASQFSSDHQKS